MTSTWEALLLAQNLQNSSPVKLGSTILTGPSPTMSLPITAGYNHLEAIYTTRKDSGGGGAFTWMRLNGDSANDYQWVNQIGNNATGTSGSTLVNYWQMGLCAGLSDTAGYFATGRFTIGNISSTSVAKNFDATSSLVCNTTTYYKASFGGVWNQTAAVTSVTLIPDTGGNFVAGSSLSIYGWN